MGPVAALYHSQKRDEKVEEMLREGKSEAEIRAHFEPEDRLILKAQLEGWTWLRRFIFWTS